MTPPPYTIGDEISVGYAFKNSAGAAADPTTITLMIQTPAGVETTHVYGTDPGVSRASAGVYAYTLALAEAGIYTVRWIGRWIGTGAGAHAHEETIPVRPSRFANP